MLRADGTRFPVLVNAVLDRDSDGDPQLVRVAIFDATERRRYEQELLAARKRAEESEATATRIARTLQETLMPPRSPSIPGLEIATAFRPAGTGTEIGGDFYDVFQRSDHDWIISMGDVAGKGVEAAVVANLARFTLRGLAVSETSPASMLTDLNQVIFNHSRDRFCTVALIRLHQHDGAWHVTLGMGGHPVPLVINQAVDTEALNKPSFLVGAFEEAVFADRSFLLEPGATLMLYTDGVTEARRGNDDFYGEDRLRDLVRETALDPDQLVAAVLTDVLDFQNEYAKDDIALIAVRRPPART